MYDTKPNNITVRVDHMEVQKEAVKGGTRSVKPAGPWVVRRPTKDGRVVIRYRHPSTQERQSNRVREKNRRSVTRKIFYGIRKFGNYNLSKKADTIDILKALCEEAGWHVEEDGTVYKKKVAYEVGGCYKRMEYSTKPRTVLSEVAQEDHNIDLRLSLSLVSHRLVHFIKVLR